MSALNCTVVLKLHRRSTLSFIIHKFSSIPIISITYFIVFDGGHVCTFAFEINGIHKKLRKAIALSRFLTI
jgi:hypothetical protein